MFFWELAKDEAIAVQLQSGITWVLGFSVSSSAAVENWMKNYRLL